MAKMTENNSTLKEPITCHTGFAVAVQTEDNRSWTQGTVTEYCNEDQNDRSYRIHTTKPE